MLGGKLNPYYRWSASVIQNYSVFGRQTDDIEVRVFRLTCWMLYGIVPLTYF
jgi:hypothetical protein